MTSVLLDDAELPYTPRETFVEHVGVDARCLELVADTYDQSINQDR